MSSQERSHRLAVEGAWWAGAVTAHFPCRPAAKKDRGKTSLQLPPSPPLFPALSWMNPAPLLLLAWQVSASHTVKLPQTCPCWPHLATPTRLLPGQQLCKKLHTWTSISETAREPLGLGHWGRELCHWSKVTWAWSWGPGLTGGQKAPGEKRPPREVMLASNTNCHGQGLLGAKKRCFVSVTWASRYLPGQHVMHTVVSLRPVSPLPHVPKENSNLTVKDLENVVFLWSFPGKMEDEVPSSTRGFWEILFHHRCSSFLQQLPPPFVCPKNLPQLGLLSPGFASLATVPQKSFSSHISLYKTEGMTLNNTEV